MRACGRDEDNDADDHDPCGGKNRPTTVMYQRARHLHVRECNAMPNATEWLRHLDRALWLRRMCSCDAAATRGASHASRRSTVVLQVPSTYGAIGGAGDALML